jgi:hypothetical protein
MKDISSYMESILCQSLPTAILNVHLTGGIYHISLRVYELTNAKSDRDGMRTLVEEMLQAELDFYFRNNLPKHKKIVEVYHHEYGV